MRSLAIVMRHPAIQDGVQMRLGERHHPIQALPACKPASKFDQHMRHQSPWIKWVATRIDPQRAVSVYTS